MNGTDVPAQTLAGISAASSEEFEEAESRRYFRALVPNSALKSGVKNTLYCSKMGSLELTSPNERSADQENGHTCSEGLQSYVSP